MIVPVFDGRGPIFYNEHEANTASTFQMTTVTLSVVTRTSWTILTRSVPGDRAVGLWLVRWTPSRSPAKRTLSPTWRPVSSAYQVRTGSTQFLPPPTGVYLSTGVWWKGCVGVWIKGVWIKGVWWRECMVKGVRGRHPPWTQSQTPHWTHRQTQLPHPIRGRARYWSGRYASYWNAFLFTLRQSLNYENYRFVELYILPNAIGIRHHDNQQIGLTLQQNFVVVSNRF